MAFVYRKQKAHEQLPIAPGPGQYPVTKDSRATNSAVGFFDTAPRKLWQTITTTPGPGQYNLTQQKLQIDGLQTLYGNSQLDFYVCDNFFTNNPGCTSVFKSKGKKFTNITNTNPGPGHYDIQTSASKRFPNSHRWQKPTKLAKYLYEQTKKPPQQINQIVIDPYHTRQGLVSEIHRPDSKNQNIKKQDLKNNYKSVFNSKVQRKTVVRPQTSKGVGPGTYNIEESYANPRKTFNCRQNPTNESKGFQPKQKANKQKQKQKQNIGPGSYQIQAPQRPHTSQSRGIACFGSKEQRFEKAGLRRKSVGYRQPGPQSYFNPARKIQANKPKKKKIAFSSCKQKADEQFHFVPSTTFTQISPFSYKPKNDFNELLKRNFIKGAIGKFGSTVQRFKEAKKQTEEISQIKPKEIFGFDFQGNKNQQEKPKIPNNFQRMKKASPKKIKIKNQESFDQRPLCYDTQSKTIACKFSQKCQLDAPFMIASSRFPHKQLDYEQEIINSLIKEQNKTIAIGENANSQQIKRSRSKILKGSTQNLSIVKKYYEIKNIEEEVSYQQNATEIGPQTYNPQLWTKKSYNILFRQ